MDLEIVFEDVDIIVVIKPSGILSQADKNNNPNMIGILEGHCQTQIFPIHRLDREVGGVMVYAKNKTAAASLSAQVQNGDFSKEYIALVHSKPTEQSGEMVDLLFKDSSKNKNFVVKKERKGVKKAILKYELIKTFITCGEEFSIVKVRLLTGRTHQIRVQFASRKMSLVGDKKYGGKDKFDNIGLWSYKISFAHPKTKEVKSFSKEPQNCIKAYM